MDVEVDAVDRVEPTDRAEDVAGVVPILGLEGVLRELGLVVLAAGAEAPGLFCLNALARASLVVVGWRP